MIHMEKGVMLDPPSDHYEVMYFMLHDYARRDHVIVYDYRNMPVFSIIILKDVAKYTIKGKSIFVGKWPCIEEHFGPYTNRSTKVKWEEIKDFRKFTSFSEFLESLPHSWVLKPPIAQSNDVHLPTNNPQRVIRRKWWLF